MDGTRHNVVVFGHGAATAADCSCAHGGTGAYCEHIWATLLAANEQNADTESPAPTLDAGAPQLPKARKRTAERKPERAKEARWESYLTLLRPQRFGKAPGTTPLPNQLQLIYVIDTVSSEDQQQLIIRLYQRRPVPNGWSRLRPMKMDRDTARQLEDQTDRELCGLLLGAAPARDTLRGTPSRNDRVNDIFTLPAGGRRLVLEKMVATHRCCLLQLDQGRAAQPVLLTWNPQPWQLWSVGKPTETGLDMVMQLRQDDQHIPLSDPWLVLAGDDGIVVHDTTVSPLNDRGAYQWVYQFRTGQSSFEENTGLQIASADIPKFMDRLYRMPRLPQLDLPEDIQRPIRDLQPVARMELYSPGHPEASASIESNQNLVTAKIWFDYAGQLISPSRQELFITPFDDVEPHGDAPAPVDQPDTQPTQAPPDQESDPSTLIRRDQSFESTSLQVLARLGFRLTPDLSDDALAIAPQHIALAVSTLISQGWIVTADRNALRLPDAPKLSVKSGIDWFELQGTITYETEDGGEQVSLPSILAALKSGQTTITLGDGSQGMLPHKWLADHGMLVDMGQVCDDHIRFEQSQAVLLDALISQQEAIDVDQVFADIRNRLANFDSISPINQAPTFQGELRPYQQEGLGWLSFLSQVGLGGILADDMGLGKTVQILAMLERCYTEHKLAGTDPAQPDGDQKQTPHPSLIVVPSSVVYNWIDEAERFAPNLRLQAYSGTDRHLLREAFTDHDVVVTSYGLLRRDIDELRHHNFEFIILDEAQAIKNPSSQSAKAARLLAAKHKLALTGTPIENHLGDLWSIFEFLNPGMLGSNTGFARMIRNANKRSSPLDEDTQIEVVNKDDPQIQVKAGEPEIGKKARRVRAHTVQIAQALRPFILRRTKQEVLDDLPPKTEQTIVCQMEPPQRKIYDDLLKHYRKTLLSKTDKSAGSATDGSTMMVLEALLRLRQAACHPGLIDPEKSSEPSAKLDVLIDRVTDLIEEGHKALVFSQFTKMLALVKTRLDRKGITYEYLDGKTRNRKKCIERFQTDRDCPIFLISLKAGGLGLNLTAAEYVFLLDPWWNPAVEAQAIDRAHRIGQEHHVFAYRLICQDTVEQRIAELQAGKKALADAIVGGQDSLLSNLTRDDLERLLS